MANIKNPRHPDHDLEKVREDGCYGGHSPKTNRKCDLNALARQMDAARIRPSR